MKKHILILLCGFVPLFGASQNNKIFKVRAKEITMKTATTKYGTPSIVDFLVAFDFNSSRITFYRNKTETYDIIKNTEAREDDDGSITCYFCKNEDLKDYEVCLYSPNTKDKVIFTVKESSSTVTTMIICAYIKE